jgi:type IV secretory pathway component VirB8
MQTQANLPWLTCQKAAQLLAWVVIALVAALLAMVGWHVTNPVTIREPVYIEFQSHGNTIARIERISDSIARRSVVVGAEARRFVVDRETVDKTSESERYPRVFAMSDDVLARLFREQYGGPESLFKREGFKRSVRVSRDSSLGDGVHQIEIVTSDTDKVSNTPTEQEWIVTMTYDFRTQNKSYEDGLLNPLGFVVTEYTISKRVKK